MSSLLFPTRRVMWMPLDYAWQPSSSAIPHCCATMADSLAFTCDQHTDPFECPDVALVHHEIFGEYGIPIRDGGQTHLLIDNCPWCGTQLPARGRDAWFDATEAAGLDNTPTDKLPERYRTAAWRSETKA